MVDKSSYPARALKKTLRLFFLAALLFALASVGLSRLFTEDVVVMVETTSRENLNILWDSYRHYFMDGGRVFRPKNKNDTVSEGQAYAMLRALWQKDRETFDAVYKWSEDNLSRLRTRGDHLLAWRYGQDAMGTSAILDDNAALDADLDYALALFIAARQWPDGKSPAGTMAYRDKALAVAESVMRKGVFAHPNGELIQLPWPVEEARASDREILLNPSYFSPGHYRIFELETGNPRWGKLANDVYSVLARMLYNRNGREGQVVAVPDWILMRADGTFAADAEKGYVSGWDAFRIWWRIRLDYDLTGNPDAKDFIQTHLDKFLTKSMLDSGGEVASESNRDGTPRNKWSSPAQTATYGWSVRAWEPNLSRSLQRQALRRLVRDGQYMYFQDKEDYYTNSWAWLSMAEGDLQFPFAGLFKFVPAPEKAPAPPSAGAPAGPGGTR